LDRIFPKRYERKKYLKISFKCEKVVQRIVKGKSPAQNGKSCPWDSEGQMNIKKLFSIVKGPQFSLLDTRKKIFLKFLVQNPSFCNWED
jgi:hypothetical protein